MSGFVVIEGCPGGDLIDFSDYSDAVAYLNELADDLTTQGYEIEVGWASSSNLSAFKASRGPDWFISSIERDEDGDDEDNETGRRVADIIADLATQRDAWAATHTLKDANPRERRIIRGREELTAAGEQAGASR